MPRGQCRRATNLQIRTNKSQIGHSQARPGDAAWQFTDPPYDRTWPGQVKAVFKLTAVKQSSKAGQFGKL